jgi:hypothetical protein
LLTADSKFPICHEVFAVDFHPRQNDLHFTWRKVPLQQLSVGNGNDRFVSLELCMDVRSMVASIVKEIQGDCDALKHGNHRHTKFLLAERLRSRSRRQKTMIQVVADRRLAWIAWFG